MDAGSWEQVSACIVDLKSSALSLAERAAHTSGPEVAAAFWQRAREKFALAQEVEFFGDLHPAFSQWVSERNSVEGRS